MAQVQRTIPLLLPADEDLRETLAVFQRVQQQLSAPCFNGGKPLSAVALHRACYQEVKSQLNAQMTCTAIRLVAAASQCACSNHCPPQRPFQFRRRRALFLIGPRGWDARLCPDGTLSIWTVAGRKQLSCRVPEAFLPRLAQAKTIESLTVVEQAGKLVGRLTITLEVPDPPTARPEIKAVVGIDLNETNALVAVDGQERLLFVSGKAVKVRNRRTAKTRARATATQAGGPQGTASGHAQWLAGAATAWPPATTPHPDVCPDRGAASGGVGTVTGSAGLRTAAGATAAERADPWEDPATPARAVATRLDPPVGRAAGTGARTACGGGEPVLHQPNLFPL
ncbi:hypothetical protein KTAU_00390 [Thermogemmatispora aurantia]|jgi:hypothetical protein|uniref:Uncharacterized protein n=1 Tax=Thermogemmatispora aurantia TaxID=2045279 RepID=A0A5J4K3L7_9CHLR|nr:hypothetical protein [Thermogemmatispora aurantia]GER81400.1 hypothetical protein KTAU_00390 [Thermogemmatispora aurantia]